jgi:hypothetical protein
MECTNLVDPHQLLCPWFTVVFVVGIKTTGEQISILCHNGTIFDKPREKTGLAIKRHVEVPENPK